MMRAAYTKTIETDKSVEEVMGLFHEHEGVAKKMIDNIFWLQLCSYHFQVYPKKRQARICRRLNALWGYTVISVKECCQGSSIEIKAVPGVKLMLGFYVPLILYLFFFDIAIWCFYSAFFVFIACADINLFG